MSARSPPKSGSNGSPPRASDSQLWVGMAAASVVQSGMALTGPFKMVKGDLKREGYDIGAIDDPVYVMKPGSGDYERLDADYLETIRAGNAGF